MFKRIFAKCLALAFASEAFATVDVTVQGNGDYDTWRAHFGQTSGSGSGALAKSTVPEPATFALLVIATAAWLARRKRSVLTDCTVGHHRGLASGLIVAAGMAALLAANPAFAAKWTWNGSQGNDHWTNTPNWTPIGPVANDGTADVHFDGFTRLTPDMNANWNVHSLTFDTFADGFTLGSSTGSTLTLGAGGITDNCEIAAGSHTITHAITLSAAQTWSSAGTYGAFSVTGAVGGLRKDKCARAVLRNVAVEIRRIV